MFIEVMVNENAMQYRSTFGIST